MPPRLVVLTLFVSVVVGLWVFGNAPQDVSQPAGEISVTDPALADTVIVRPLAAVESDPPSWPDRCERVRFDDDGRFRRVRKSFGARDRREMRAWLAAVAAEFEPRDAQNFARFLRALAVRESSYRPWAVHVLSEDQEAAQRAARRLSKGDHDFADARVVIWTEVDGVLVKAWPESAWLFSRGLYGFAPALWLRSGGRWGRDLPPWALCDRAVATTLLVWATRDAVRECAAEGFEPTWRVLNRRISSGHCRVRAAKFEKGWTKRALAQGLDPDAVAWLDERRWSERKADRSQLLQRLRSLD